MSSAPDQNSEQASTTTTGSSRRWLGRRIALCAVGVGVIGVSVAIGWCLQSVLHPATPVVSDAAAPVETKRGDASDRHAAQPASTPSHRSHTTSAAAEADHPPEPDQHGSRHRSAAGDPSRSAVAGVSEGESSRHADGHATGASEAASDEAPGSELAADLPTAAVNLPPSADELARADAFGEQKFDEGDAVAALREFDWLAQHQDRSLDDRFHYRCGICAETLGKFDRALEEYGAALTSGSEETVRVLSRLGQARVWRSLGHGDMATQLLANALLTNGNERRAAVVRPFVAYLLADALTSESQSSTPTPLTADDGILFPPWAFDLFERSLLKSIRAVETEGVPIVSGVRVLSPDADPVLQANLPRMGVQSIVDALCHAAERQTTWTPAARQAVVGRSAEICLSHGSLGLCLDVLTAPLGLVWTEADNEISVSSVDEVAIEVVSSRRREAAYRALVHAVRLYPDFVLAPHARITMGNLALQDHRFDEAAGHYNAVFEIAPRSAVRSDAWFNLAKLHLQCDRAEPALDAFWHVIDSGAAPGSAAVASLYIGRLLLDAEQPRRAILPLTRATQWTTESAVRAKSVLCLAAAHLLYGNPKAANDVLMDFRSDIEAQSRQAALLSALARYRVAESPTRRLYEGQALLTAADPVRPEDFFGRYGWYLCGHAYEDLMLPEMATEVYREALRRFERPPYRDAIVFGLASCLADSGESATSVAQFDDLLQNAEPAWQRTAGFRLCRLQLDLDQPLNASRTARKLLEISGELNDKSRALRLLGEAYQRLGDHAAAALCFAGSTPGESPAVDAGEQ